MGRDFKPIVLNCADNFSLVLSLALFGTKEKNLVVVPSSRFIGHGVFFRAGGRGGGGGGLSG